MSPKILGSLVAVVVVGVGGYLLVANRTDEPVQAPVVTSQPSPSASASISPQLGPVVRYDGSSFSPDRVTIKVGQKVTFINDSTAELVVASDPHPIHTNLGGFDSEQNIGQGQTYVYTFTKAGDWGYHNHEKSSAKGRVIVE